MNLQLKKCLSEILSREKLADIYNSFDIVGNIAIIRSTETSREHPQIIGKAIMRIHKNVKTVLVQTSPISGAFRLRKLDCIAGEDRSTTIHKEFGCLFSVDVRECYFSPRLLYERMRIANQVANGEVIVNMFAGVGCFSIIIAKHSNAAKIYSIDLNDVAIQSMRENIRLNRVFGRVTPESGDAGEIIKKRLIQVADRVLMPLPEKAFKHLPNAMLSLKKSGGWIHYYASESAKKRGSAIAKVKQKVSEKLDSLCVMYKIVYGRIVRTTGPNRFQVVLDINIQ